VAIRDVRQGDANQVGGQQMLDLFQLVKDAEWSRDRLGRHLRISVEVIDGETGKNRIFYGNDEMVGGDEL
jgi:hypothetical protein